MVSEAKIIAAINLMNTIIQAPRMIYVNKMPTKLSLIFFTIRPGSKVALSGNGLPQSITKKKVMTVTPLKVNQQ